MRNIRLMTALIAAGIIVAAAGPLRADKPLIGILGITADSPRCQIMSQILGKSIDEAVAFSGVFDPINSAAVTEQLLKFQCMDETCFIPFAKVAKIGVVVKGDLRDTEKGVRLTLKAFGTGAPFYGKLINQYKADIPLQKGYNATIIGNIFREHSHRFISHLLSKYRAPFTLKEVRTKGSYAGNGIFPLFRKIDSPIDPAAGLAEIGTAYLKNGELFKTETDRGEAADNDIVIVDYRERSREIDEFMYQRKREMVLGQGSYQDFIYAILLTAPASFLMPVLAPTVGYMANNDWQGLALWSINAPFYIYLEIDGLTNIPALYRRERRDISREVHARFRFALYMLCSGGLSLVMDATAHSQLRHVSQYGGEAPVLSGNSLIAAYFSLVSGGGGHFYRGHRYWGYFYFHLNNLLLYFMIREFSHAEWYDGMTDSYRRGEINEERAYALAGAFAAVKIAEIIHVLFLRDEIWNGEVSRETFAVEPFIIPSAAGTALGLQFSLRF